MAPPKLADLRKQLNDINLQYEAYFAGHPRISRDLALMDSMRVATGTMVQALATLPSGGERDETLTQARNALKIYEEEAARIREAQAGGPDAIEAHRLANWVTFTARRYMRHFAGKARSTRDVGLITELIEDFRRLNEDISALTQTFDSPELKDARTASEANLQLYLAERTAIIESRTSGTVDEKTDVLAQLANDQFQLYQDHFAGKSRASRRPDLLERILDNLNGVLDAMGSVKAEAPTHPHNSRNIEVVQSRLEFYRSELDEVRKARQESSFKDLVGALGSAANGVFEEYREHFAAKDRRTRDLNRLSRLCDQLYEVAHQMDDLDRVREDETNLQNLAIVVDNLRLYEREFDEIQKVQNQPAA